MYQRVAEQSQIWAVSSELGSSCDFCETVVWLSSEVWGLGSGVQLGLGWGLGAVPDHMICQYYRYCDRTEIFFDGCSKYKISNN